MRIEALSIFHCLFALDGPSKEKIELQFHHPELHLMPYFQDNVSCMQFNITLLLVIY